MGTCGHDYNENTCPTCYAHDAYDVMCLTWEEWFAEEALSGESHVRMTPSTDGQQAA